MRIEPFKGYRFGIDRVRDVSQVVAPPYDQISPEIQDRLYAMHPYNIVRVSYPRDEPGPGEVADKYERAGETLERWLREGRWERDDRESIYPYSQTYRVGGREVTRSGFIALGEVSDYARGIVLPHERTHAGPKEGRLRLLRAARTQLEPIFLLYDADPPLTAPDGPPDMDVEEDGVRTRVWRLPAEELEIDTPFLIADGHHRYTMALRYREEMRALHGPGAWDSVMMLVVDGAVEDPPVLPIHRLLANIAPPRLGERVRDLEEILTLVDDETVTVGTAAWEDGELVHRAGPLGGEPPAVCALQEEVIAALPEAGVSYEPDAVAAEEAVRRRDATSAVFLPPTRVERIRAIVERGERLPEKSTYFWPKPRTGMVIRPLDLANRATTGRPVPAS
jgi:uncharacterized protein (DUF1015 family)